MNYLNNTKLTLEELLSGLSEEWNWAVSNLLKKYADFDEIHENENDSESLLRVIIKEYIRGISALVFCYPYTEEKLIAELERLLFVYFGGTSIVYNSFLTIYKQSSTSDTRKAIKSHYLALLARLTPYVVELYPSVEEYAENGEYSRMCEEVSKLRHFINRLKSTTKIRYSFSDDGVIEEISITHQYGGGGTDKLRLMHGDVYLSSILFPPTNFPNINSSWQYYLEAGDANRTEKKCVSFAANVDTLSKCLESIIESYNRRGNKRGKKNDPRAAKIHLAKDCAELFNYLAQKEDTTNKASMLVRLFIPEDYMQTQYRIIDWICDLLGLNEDDRYKERLLELIPKRQ